MPSQPVPPELLDEFHNRFRVAYDAGRELDTLLSPPPNGLTPELRAAIAKFNAEKKAFDETYAKIRALTNPP